RPGAAVMRELRAYLLTRVSPMLAVEGALEIVRPDEVEIRIDLTLAVDAIESSGSVANDATTAMANLLDPATGGLDQAGWPLGGVPTDTDIAAALIGIKHLESIETIAVSRTDGQPLTILAATEIVRLAKNGVVVSAVVADTEMV